ncbi:MAG TPA: ABC transporter ATP-binding protein, partial [Actinomycetota bacterium]|nr:ABC transporter ATP-binding protein [Actinomycetota bacterium]
GRENIFLSGAVLGMRRADIVRQLAAIIDFAGVEKFVDTPIKRYSTGMYLRLAFAVAAHLDTDILLVDEVLAVGDAEFQKKCLGRMAEIGSTGRTVLFVSHSMPSLLRLCPRLILLDRGGVVADGPAAQVARTYLESGGTSAAERSWANVEEAPGDDVARLKSVRVVNAAGEAADEIDVREPIGIEVQYWHLAEDPAVRPAVNLHCFNEDGVCLFVTADYNNRAAYERPRSPGVARSTCWIPGNFLAEGRVLVKAVVSTFNPTEVHAQEDEAISFQVVDHSTGEGARGDYTGDWPGVVRPKFEWTVTLAGESGGGRAPSGGKDRG